MDVNNVLDQMDLTNIYRKFHPEEAKYTFLSNAHGTFSKIDHMIGHKTNADSGPWVLCVVAATNKFTWTTEILWRKRDGIAAF